MKQTTVLGIGNRLMMDDGIGIYIVEILRNKNLFEGVKYVTGETDVDYCLSEIEGSDLLIVIDAVSTGKKPGEITIIPLAEALPLFNSEFTAHNIHFIDILTRTTSKLNVLLIGIEICEITYNIGLSGTIYGKLNEITDKVSQLISETLKGTATVS